MEQTFNIIYSNRSLSKNKKKENQEAMELPHIGATCEICNRTDFLPFRCAFCNKMVCTEHKNNHGSDCPIELTSNADVDDSKKPASKLIPRSLCQFCKQSTPELALVECLVCHGEYCLAHRHQHNCSSTKEQQDIARLNRLEQDEKVKRNEEILNKLRMDGNTGVKAQAYKNTSKNQQLAKRIRIMKIKQSAKGPTNIPMTDRLHFHVDYEPIPTPSTDDRKLIVKQLNVFTSTNMSVGKLIDYIAAQLGLTNSNNIAQADQLVLRHTRSCTVLDSQKKFADLISDEMLEDGDDLIITYVKPKI